MRAKVHHKPIEGERVRLRLLDRGDIEMTRCWRNQDDVRKWFVFTEIIESDQQAAWFERYQTVPNDYVYVVEEKTDSGWKPVGQISLYKIDWDNGTGEYGRILAGEKSGSGKGLFYDASLLLMNYWSRHHKITDFFLEVKEDNVRAKRLYDKLGFEVEAVKDGVIEMRRIVSAQITPAPFVASSV